MSDILMSEYFTLKLIIVLMVLVMIATVTRVFYRLGRDKRVKRRKADLTDKIASLIDTYFVADEESSKRALYELRHFFEKDRVFQDVTIEQLKGRVENDPADGSYRELFLELGGMSVIQQALLSKKPVTIYKALLTVDFFGLLPPKDIVLPLRDHQDIRIRILAACTLFRYNNEIFAQDILDLEPILSPMVEIKVFNELQKRNHSRSQSRPVAEVIKECLGMDVGDKMRGFLDKSLRLLNNDSKNI